MRLLILMLFSFYIQPIFQEVPTDYILWGAKKLTWENFKGKAQQGQTSGAMSSCFIHMEISPVESHQVQVKVEALFNTKRSWAATHSPSLLKHEQGHFAIAEIFARKLRKQLLTTPFHKRNYESYILKLYNTSNKEMDEFHDFYDKQTDHSRKEVIQSAWDNQIEQELRSLSAYNVPMISIQLNN